MRREFDEHLGRLLNLGSLEPGVREEVWQEWRDHMEARFADLCAEGMEPGRAIRQVLREFGDADQLARTVVPVFLDLRHRQRRRHRLWTCASGAVMATALLFGPAWLGRISGIQHASQADPGLCGTTENPTAERIGKDTRQENLMQNRTMLSGVMTGIVGSLALATAAQADAVPTTVNHQGVVLVNGVRYTGTGHFKFAIINTGGDNLWTHDGSQIPGPGEPATATTTLVNDGIYSVQLGGGAMTPITASVFATDSCKLRVWFGDSPGTIQQLIPDHAMATVPYAFSAQTVPDDAITAAKLASENASLNKVSAGAMTAAANGKIGVGVANPAFKLDVNESIRTQQGLYCSVVGQNDGAEWNAMKPSVLNPSGGYWYWFQASSGANPDGAFVFRQMDDWSQTRPHLLKVETGTGNIGLNTWTTGQKLDIYGGNGRVQSGYSWLTNSDARYKENVSDLPDALAKVLALRGVHFDVKPQKPDEQTIKNQIGFIAQELEAEYPELVVTDSTGYKSVAYDKMTAVLVQAVKELKARQDRELADRDALIADLKSRLDRLEASHE